MSKNDKLTRGKLTEPVKENTRRKLSLADVDVKLIKNSCKKVTHYVTRR